MALHHPDFSGVLGNRDLFLFKGVCMSIFKEIPLTDEQKSRPNAPINVYKNDEFLVQIYNLDGEPTRITVNKTKRKGNNWADGITWDQLMQVKRLVGFAKHCAIEIYPPDEHIVNVANIRHLWVVDMPEFIWKKDKVK